MRGRRRHVLLGCLVILLAATACTAPARWEQSAETLSVDASTLPPLSGTRGVGGPFAGIHNGALFVAGGAAFPLGPPWEGGEKVWYDDIRVLVEGETAWRTGPRLPRPLAYGASITLPEGVVLIGGCDALACSDAVRLMQWDPAGDRIVFHDLPSLPEPSAFHTAALYGRTIYVVAGQRSVDPADLIGRVWCLDLDAPEGEREWIDCGTAPGPARIKAVSAVQSGGGDPRFLYLFSGEVPSRGADGALQYRYLNDAWRLDPRRLGQEGEPTWRRLGDLPKPVAAATALPEGQSHVLVFSGSTGRHVTDPAQDHPPFTPVILAYHTITDTWVEAGELAEGVVTTTAVRWRGSPVLPSGETRPGVRTPRVQTVTLHPPRVPFGFINYVVLVLYLGLLVGMGFYFSRREKGTDDFFLAGRRIPWWAAGLSIYATQLSAITFIATPGLTYATDWLVTPSATVILMMAPIVIAFYLPFYRRLNVTTAYEYLEKRFSGGVRLFGSGCFIAYQLARMAIILYLPALALAAITGINIFLCILIMGVLSTLYTVLGGIEAVIWTDVIQSVVLLGGVIVGLAIAVGDVGGVGEVFRTAAADGKLKAFDFSTSATELATWSLMLGSLMLQFGPYTTDQAIVQRYLTTKDERSAARGIWMNGLMSLPFLFFFYILGTSLYVFFKHNPELLSLGMQNDQIFPLFVAQQLPAGVSGLVIAGVFAASMSSLDSGMHSISTAVTTDFYRRWRPAASDAACLRLARWIVVAMGALATVTASILAGFDISSLFFFFQTMLGLVSSGLVGIFILGIFTRRSTSSGVLTGALVSLAVLVWVTQFTAINFYLYAVIGIGTAVMVGYLASLVLGRPRTDIEGLTWRTLKGARGESGG